MKKTLTLLFAATLAANCVHAQNWLTTGNAGLTASNFLGTTDPVPLIFKVNNKAAGRIDYSTGVTKANTSFGFQTLNVNTAGGNSAFGYLALPVNTSGNANTAVGFNSMNRNVTGFSNTAFGSQSLAGNVAGFYNTAVGQACLSGSRGNDNTAVGRFAFVSLATGSGNTAIGSGANVSDSTLSNVTLLGFLTVGTASNSVQIGNSSVTSVKAANNVVIVSDGRFKKNVKQNVPGLSFINALSPVTYNYDIKGLDKYKGVIAQQVNANDRSISDAASKQYEDAVNKKEKILYSGFVAQDVEKVAEKLGYDFSGVYKPQNDKDPYGLSYAEFVVPLVKAVQELSKQNDDLKNQNDGQQKINTDLQKQINDLKASMALGSQSTSAGSNVQTVQLNNSAVLEQNVPNPFVNATTINYTLPQHYSKAVMIIADKTGKTVKEINLGGNGKGTVKLDAASLSSGTYHYSLYVDGHMTDSKQMLLSK